MKVAFVANFHFSHFYFHNKTDRIPYQHEGYTKDIRRIYEG